MIDLLVKFSVPATVAIVPIVGRIKLVAAVVFNVMALALEPVVPVVVKAAPVLILPPKVMVLPLFATPVPPLIPLTIPVTFVAVPIKLAVISPALKLPFASLLTMVLFVAFSVAALAKIVAVLISVAVDPPTVATVGKVAVPAKSPANCTLPFTKLVASGVAVLIVPSTYVFIAFTDGYLLSEFASLAILVLLLPTSSFKSKAACVSVLIILSASAVLLTKFKPRFVFASDIFEAPVPPCAIPTMPVDVKPLLTSVKTGLFAVKEFNMGCAAKVLTPVTDKVPAIDASLPKIAVPLTFKLLLNVVTPDAVKEPPTIKLFVNVLSPAISCAVVKSTKFFVADPVPPFAIPKMPVTPDVKGKPVKLVAIPAEGVPKSGVTKIGETDKTMFPDPVVPVTLLK